MQSEIYYSLTAGLLTSWQDLWDRSDSGHLFNSPAWFLACRSVFNYSMLAILAVYRNSALVAVLPLVQTRKWGIKCFIPPGNQYLDRSSLLLLERDPLITGELLIKLKELRNVYLSETPEIHKSLFSSDPCMKIFFSSVGWILPLQPDPYRFLNSKHKKQIRKVISADPDGFRLETSAGSFADILPVILDIERRSTKKSEHKEVFSQPAIARLFNLIDQYRPGTILVNLLYYRNRPVSYQVGFASHGTYHCYQIAFLAEYAHLIPGRILLYQSLQTSMNCNFHTLDFSRGTNRYKKDFTPHSYTQFTVIYSSHLWIRAWWSLTITVFNYLQSRPGLFNITRVLKLKFV